MKAMKLPSWEKGYGKKVEEALRTDIYLHTPHTIV